MAKLITFLVALQLLWMVSADEDNFIVPDGVFQGGAAWGGRSSLVACLPPFCCKLKCHCCKEQLNKQEGAFAVLDGGRTKETPSGEAAGGGDARKDDDKGKGGAAGMEAALGAGVHKDVGRDSGTAGVRAALSGSRARKNTGGGQTGAGGGGARRHNFTMPAEGKTDSPSSITASGAALCKPPNCCKYKCSCCME